MTFWPWSKELEVGIGEIDEQHKWLGYPETEAHKAEHNKFTGQIMDLLDRHDSGESAGDETLTLLKEWLTHHILKVDKAYVEHFKAHGVT